MEYPIEGSCQCGQISYKLHQPPVKVIACHCTECQKLSGDPFSVTAMIKAQDIEFFGELKDWSRSSDSGNTNAAKFCPTCGNRVYQFNPADMSMVKLKLKPVHIKDDTLFKPTVHVWVKEKLSWVVIPEGDTVFETSGG